MTDVEDYAVILGVQKYPGLTDLNGPENDAALSASGWSTPREAKFRGSGRFRIAKPGWGKGNIRTILSSDYPPFDNLDEARPILHDIQRAFIDLHDLAEANEQSGRGLVAGHRLYIYMAGHAIEPQNGKTALLMANAKPRRFGFHVLGRDYAEFFSYAGLFEGGRPVHGLLPRLFSIDPTHTHPFRPALRSHSTRPDGLPARIRYEMEARSRERLIDGQVRGVFTAALLAGL